MAAVRLVLDSGAVSALAEGNITARALLREALAARSAVVVPAPVITETIQGTPRDANVNRLVKTTRVIPLDELLARDAGRLLNRARSASTIDAMVVATADAETGSAILTSDVADLRRLTSIAARTAIIPL